MAFQINIGNNFSLLEELDFKLEAMITGKLNRYIDYVAGLEVFLSKENESKDVINDQSILSEALLKDSKPIPVKETANNELAIKNTIKMINSLLSTIDERMNSMKQKIVSTD